MVKGQSRPRTRKRRRKPKWYESWGRRFKSCRGHQLHSRRSQWARGASAFFRLLEIRKSEGDTGLPSHMHHSGGTDSRPSNLFIATADHFRSLGTTSAACDRRVSVDSSPVSPPNPTVSEHVQTVPCRKHYARRLSAIPPMRQGTDGIHDAPTSDRSHQLVL